MRFRDNCSGKFVCSFPLIIQNTAPLLSVLPRPIVSPLKRSLANHVFLAYSVAAFSAAIFYAFVILFAVPTTLRACKSNGSQFPNRADLAYRADIDVLRAIAVLAVVAFHWHVKSFSGGFVGVDVFFVVSGFLITGIISRQMELGSFTFTGFFERRIKRIWPALYAMIFVTAFAVWFILLPSQVDGFTRSILAVLAFGSNILFWQETGYFDAPALSKPLLHTWSLAVEEQFYLGFPILLRLFWGRPGFNTSTRAIKLLTLVAALSFGLSVLQVDIAPSAAFFLAPGRAWEFLLGAILAVGKMPRLHQRWMTSSILALGLVMLFAAILGFGSTTRFPGYAALLPCLGAALCIWANTERKPGGLEQAAIRPLVFFGRISYSLYIWHWPIWVLAQSWYEPNGDFSGRSKLVMFAVVSLVSYISYRFIEQPVRRSRTITGRRLFAYGAMASGLLVLIGITGVIHRDGTGPSTLRAEALARYRINVCFIEHTQDIGDLNVGDCLRNKQGARNVLLIGDSFAAHYYPGLSKIAGEFNLNISQANSSSCLPFPEVPQTSLPNCDALNKLVNDWMRANRPDFIIMSGNWWAATQGLGYDRFKGALRVAVESAASVAPVILLGPSIQYGEPLPDLLARSPYIWRPVRVVLGVFDLDRKMSQDFSDLKNVTFVSVTAATCPNNVCPSTVDGVPMEWDAAHLTSVGSERVVEAIKPYLSRVFMDK